MSKYLGKCVFAALVAMGSANAYAQVQVNCTSSCYEYPTQGGGEDPGWDQGGSGDGGESGNGTGGSDNPDPEQEQARLESCLELREKGLPEGCDRNLANQGPQRPAITQPETLTRLFSTVPNPGMAIARESDAAMILASCYADVSNPPTTCETQYREAMSHVWDHYSLTPAQRNLYQQALAIIQTALMDARDTRTVVRFFENYGVGFSFSVIGISLTVLANQYTVGQYNNVLIAAREQKQCKLWFQVWDLNECSAV